MNIKKTRKCYNFKITTVLIALTFFYVNGLGYLYAEKDNGKKIVAYRCIQETWEDKIYAIGTLKALEYVELSANVTDSIKKINFNDGQRVKAGQVIAELKNSQEKAIVKEIQANLNEAKINLERAKKLIKSGAISKTQFDNLNQQFLTFSAKLTAAKSNLSDRIISAPFSGILGVRNVSPGNLVRPGDIIARLYKIDQLKLDFNVSAKHLESLKKGLEIIFTTDAFPNKEFKAKISNIETNIAPETQSILVRSIFDNKNNLLKPGMLVNINLKFKSRKSISIPEEALLQSAKKHYVMLIKKDKKAKKIILKIGKRRPGKVEILKGLKKGDLIVTHGNFTISEGAKLKIEAFQKLGESASTVLKKINKNK